MDEPSNVRVIDKAVADIDPDDLEEILKAKLPLIENPRMASYLSYRAMGFSIREAAQLANVKQGTVARWRREDEDFAAWEKRGMTFLQHDLADDLLRAEFNRCMRLDMRVDYKVLRKANFAGPDNLTEREFELLKQINRGKYGAANKLAIERVLAPDGEGLRATAVNVQVNVGGEHVESEAARVTAARQLLQQFNATAKYAAEDRDPLQIEASAKTLDAKDVED